MERIRLTARSRRRGRDRLHGLEDRRPGRRLPPFQTPVLDGVVEQISGGLGG
ncbi:MAG: hypothetical protein ABEN55_15840 [Bradymonadaceae bacterium]